MATDEECRAAIKRVAEQLASLDVEIRRKYIVERLVACRIPDLDVLYHLRLHLDGLDLVEPQEGETPQVRITVQSDDLVALAEGRLDFVKAWLTGRVTLEAGLTDLLRLRRLL